MGDATVDTSLMNPPVIYLTAFGPFGPHVVNASQSAVETIDIYALEKELGVKIKREIITVAYDEVKTIINARWQKFKPKMTIHVGVSGQADNIVLEQLAHNGDYDKNDVKGCKPSNHKCCPGGEDVIHSEIRMDLVTKALNNNTQLKLTCVKSTDPGRFVCDYIYYTSLIQDKARTAFIHVPTLSKFCKEDTAAAIVMAIKEMYKQVVSNDDERSKKVDEQSKKDDEQCRNDDEQSKNNNAQFKNDDEQNEKDEQDQICCKS